MRAININHTKHNSKSVARALAFIAAPVEVSVTLKPEPLKAKKPNDLVLFRLPVSETLDISDDNMRVVQKSSQRIFDKKDEADQEQTTQTDRPFRDLESQQHALVELLKTDEDCDIRLSTGFILVELYSVEGVNGMTKTAFPNFDDAIEYLAAVGARYFVAPRQDRDDDDDTPDHKLWLGRDYIDNDVRKSTLYFECDYHYKQMIQSKALEILLSFKDNTVVPEDGIQTSKQYTSKMLLFRNDDCTFVFKKAHMMTTFPDTAHRLMFVYDTIKEWLGYQTKRFIRAEYINGGDHIIGFSYRFEKIQPAADENSIVLKNDLDTLHPWKLFAAATTIEGKIEAVFGLFTAYGIDISEEQLEGEMTDYITDRSKKYVFSHRAMMQTSIPFRRTPLEIPQPRSSSPRAPVATPATSKLPPQIYSVRPVKSLFAPLSKSSQSTSKLPPPVSQPASKLPPQIVATSKLPPQIVATSKLPPPIATTSKRPSRLPPVVSGLPPPV